jgi:putative membrane protein
MIRTFVAASMLALLAATAANAQSSPPGSLAAGYQMTSTDALASKLIGSPVYSTTALNTGAPANAPATTTNTAPGNAPGNNGVAASPNGGPANNATDTNAQQIGTIRDLVVAADGKIAAVVIGIGGVLGIGEKSVAVGYADLKWATAQDGGIRGMLDTTVDALKAAPEFAYPANNKATTGAANGAQPQANNNGMAAAAPAANATLPTDPAGFAMTAGAANMFEIQSSQLALKQSQTPAITSFAQKMIDDHTKAGQNMEQAAKTENVPVPTALDASGQQQLTQLQGLSGKQFDDAYVAAQVTAHDQAVALFSNYSKSGKDGALKDFAGNTLPTLQDHQQMIHQIAGK